MDERNIKINFSYIHLQKNKKFAFSIRELLLLLANRPHEVEPTIKKSLEDLQLEYVDLYLVHTPFTILINEDGSFKVVWHFLNIHV